MLDGPRNYGLSIYCLFCSKINENVLVGRLAEIAESTAVSFSLCSLFFILSLFLIFSLLYVKEEHFAAGWQKLRSLVRSFHP